MTASDLVFASVKRRKESAIFKGTLIGILVSFFILISLSYLLNLADNFIAESGGTDSTSLKLRGTSETAQGGAEPLSFFRDFFRIPEANAAVKIVSKSAPKKPYSGQVMINSGEKLELLPGEEIVYRIGFKNIGGKTWTSGGVNFVSVYTYSPKYRKSVFQDGWYKSNQPAKLKEKKVAPGQIGSIEFKIKAPKTLGAYTETFHLAAENKAWIEGGGFSVPILVVAKKNAAGQAVMPASSGLKTSVSASLNQQLAINNQPLNRPFSAFLLSKSHEKIEARAGEVIDLRLLYKNTGTSNWDLVGLIVPEEALEEDGKSVFYNPTWPSGHQPSVLGISATRPGETIALDFKVKAPEAGGTYVLKLKLVANYDREVADGVLEIPMTVTGESVLDTAAGRIKNALNMTEPEIEVGLQYFSADAPQAIDLMADRAYEMRDKSGQLLASFSAAEPVTINYDFSGKIFSVRNARLNSQYSGELHFKVAEPALAKAGDAGIFTILSMSRPTAYGHNDNQYRGGIILRQAETTGRLWIVNRLPIEQYLYGIAETSNGAPAEFIKANIVAARTYALYHYLNPYKWNNNFTVIWTTADQYYRGYVSELRRPNIVKAADDTKGQVITYQNDIVVTPYFGHSDGMTRSSASVFGGKEKPWLEPVSAIYDAGLSMFGHGVGMSQHDAASRAKADLWDYTKILKYYYNGIEVSKIY